MQLTLNESNLFFGEYNFFVVILFIFLGGFYTPFQYFLTQLYESFVFTQILFLKTVVMHRYFCFVVIIYLFSTTYYSCVFYTWLSMLGRPTNCATMLVQC